MAKSPAAAAKNKLHGMYDRLKAMASQGNSAPQDVYKALSSNAQKRIFFAHYLVDKECHFVHTGVYEEATSPPVYAEFAEGWMSKPES